MALVLLIAVLLILESWVAVASVRHMTPPARRATVAGLAASSPSGGADPDARNAGRAGATRRDWTALDDLQLIRLLEDGRA